MTGYKTLTKYELLVKQDNRWKTQGTVTEKRSAFEWVAKAKQKGFHVRFVEYQYEVPIPFSELTPEQVKQIEVECNRCSQGGPSHFNCSYEGRKIGHSSSHCTADVCF
jgi:hypothetical protein